MRKLLIICGPTATGKTDIGIKLAKKFDGEIVSADSRQVYREMDILTGKDVPKNAELRIKNLELGINNKKLLAGYRLKKTIPIWLLDVVPVDYDFNISDYFFLAKSVINDIWKRKKLPVVVGGSGFYINSLLKSYETVTIPRNEILRKELSLLDTKDLQQKLNILDRKKIDSMNNSDRNNPRRLIRAIEVAVWKNNHSGHKNSEIPFLPDSILIIGLTTSKEMIQKNIETRVKQRIKEGAVEEVKNIWKKYKDEEMLAKASTGFKEIMAYLKKEYTLNETIKLWAIRECQYANRQIVWFKKVKNINWYDIRVSEIAPQIEEKVRKWYTQK